MLHFVQTLADTRFGLYAVVFLSVLCLFESRELGGSLWNVPVRSTARSTRVRWCKTTRHWLFIQTLKLLSSDYLIATSRKQLLLSNFSCTGLKYVCSYVLRSEMETVTRLINNQQMVPVLPLAMVLRDWYAWCCWQTYFSRKNNEYTQTSTSLYWAEPSHLS